MKHLKKLLSLLALIMLCSGNNSIGAIVNPSFEDGPYGDWVVPTGWTMHNSDNFGEGVENYWMTQGDYSYNLWSFVYQANTVGAYESIYQIVNLTGITEILFDVRLSCEFYGNPCTFQDYMAVFLVDGTPYWTGTSAGTYINQSIDVSGLSPGPHTIELRQECIKNESYDPSCWTQWDNLRAIPEPATLLLLGLGGLFLRKRKYI